MPLLFTDRPHNLGKRVVSLRKRAAFARNPARGSASRRRGGLTIELVIGLPLVIIASLALFQFGVLLLVQQSVTHAATVGARGAAKRPNIHHVAQHVNEVLQKSHGLTLSDAPHSGVKVVLKNGAAPPVNFGDPRLACNDPAAAPLHADEVRVTVCVSLTKSPLINPLSVFGVDFTGKRFEISAVATRE